ncbi:hypothetical protein IQ07DRAFT_101551 [Pyrenochaeta sp. DS3sAY3a]|nr:hypothetical protein IQ07DRAFT_101551 [Pyrenochaeta sp. DS3sAY3a]
MSRLPWGRKKDKTAVRPAAGTVGLNVGFAPFFMVTTSMQLAKPTRPEVSIEVVTWNTLQFTPLILLDAENQSVSLVNLSGIMTFLVGRSNFTSYIEMDVDTRIGRCAIEEGLGKELLCCALANNNERPALARQFVNENMEKMSAAFRASDRPVIEDTVAHPRIPVVPGEGGWTNEAIELAIERYLRNNRVRNDRILSWYQHVYTACTVWDFPMNDPGKPLLPAWDAGTCTPDIPLKSTVQATISGNNVCWQRWLEGEFLVMALSGSVPRDKAKEPIGALKVSNHVLAIVAPGCTTAITARGLELQAWGKVARGPNPSADDPKILHYRHHWFRHFLGRDGQASQGGDRITTGSTFCYFWVGTPGPVQ